MYACKWERSLKNTQGPIQGRGLHMRRAGVDLVLWLVPLITDIAYANIQIKFLPFAKYNVYEKSS